MVLVFSGERSPQRDQGYKAQSLLEAQYVWESAPRSSLFRAEEKVAHLEKKNMDVLEIEEHTIGTA